MTTKESTRTRFATLLILLLVLATGSVMGVALDRRLGARTTGGGGVAPGGEGQAVGDTSTAEGATEGSENRRGLIVERVGLTDRQQTQVDSIVAAYRQRMTDLHGELERELQEAYQPRYRALLEEVRLEIKDLLNPDQRAQYDSLLVEYDRRRRERRRQDSISDSRG